MSNTTKHDLIVDVSKTTGLTQADTKIVVEELLETIAKDLETGKKHRAEGFWTFYTKVRKPRPARNPKTGEVVPLFKRVVPLFKFSNEFKSALPIHCLKGMRRNNSTKVIRPVRTKQKAALYSSAAFCFGGVFKSEMRNDDKKAIRGMGETICLVSDPFDDCTENRSVSSRNTRNRQRFLVL